MNYLTIVLAIILSAAVPGKEGPERMVSLKDVSRHLNATSGTEIRSEQKNYRYWKSRWEQQPGQHPYLLKMAAAQTKLFQLTYDFDHLDNAQGYLLKANQAVRFTDASYLRALARNLNTQHRFDEALHFLKLAEATGENRTATIQLLFETCLELGEDGAAEAYLEAVRDPRDFNYIVRVARWKLYNGDLGGAAKTMADAVVRAEEMGSEELHRWTLTNLADIYDRSGREADAYELYLRALEMKSTDRFARKGIARIALECDGNERLAHRISHSLGDDHHHGSGGHHH